MPVFRHPAPLGSIETNNWIWDNVVACLLSSLSIWAKYALFDMFSAFLIFHLTLPFALWSFLHRHHYCIAQYIWMHSRPPGLPSPQGGAFCCVSSSVCLVGSVSANAVAIEAVRSFLCPYLVMARHVDQHRITNFSQCSHVFWCGSPSAPSGRRKSCLHAFKFGTQFPDVFHLFQAPPIPASTKWGNPITMWHIRNKCDTFLCSLNLALPLRRWLTWICSWYRGVHVYWPDCSIFLSNFICVVVSRISLGYMQHVLLSFLNSGFIVLPFHYHIHF
jgi:hypothetical protein